MFGLDGPRLDPNSGTPNSVLAGLQKNHGESRKIMVTVHIHIRAFTGDLVGHPSAGKISKVLTFLGRMDSF